MSPVIADTARSRVFPLAGSDDTSLEESTDLYQRLGGSRRASVHRLNPRSTWIQQALICTMKLSRLDDLTASLGMDKARNHLIEKIMHITLDMLYLLTGEDYVVLKMSGGRVTHSSSPIVSGGFCRNQSPNKDPPTDLTREEGKNNEKILELTNTITQLLTGEVPIGCQDVTVYFSMEECGDLERPNAPIRDVLSGNQHQNASHDGPQDNEPYGKSPHAGNSQVNSEEHSAPQYEVMNESPQRTSGSHTLHLQQEDTYEMVHQETDREAVPENTLHSTDLPHRAKYQFPSVIAVHEDMGCLPSTTEWEIHEDGSTHLMTSEGPLYCKRKYTLPSGATSDTLNETNHPDVTTYSCADCDKCFADVLHLQSHQKVHSIPSMFVCAECGKSFTSSSELDTHIKVHTDEKLFACSECGKCFTVKSNLLAHKVVHMGDKPFACAKCGRRFALKSSLGTHMSVHALEKPYTCSICGKCFTSNARLAFHQSTHVGQKTYECEQCRKVFTTSGSLNRHKRTHTGQKPYACRICGKCFNRDTNLYRHQTIHTR